MCLSTASLNRYTDWKFWAGVLKDIYSGTVFILTITFKIMNYHGMLILINYVHKCTLIHPNL